MYKKAKPQYIIKTVMCVQLDCVIVRLINYQNNLLQLYVKSMSANRPTLFHSVSICLNWQVNWVILNVTWFVSIWLNADDCLDVTICLIGLGIVQTFSIPIPWVRYQFLNDTFFDTNFIKSILIKLHYLKNVAFIFSVCWHLYRLNASSPDPLHKGTKYIQHNKTVQIVLIKFK